MFNNLGLYASCRESNLAYPCFPATHHIMRLSELESKSFFHAVAKASSAKDLGHSAKTFLPCSLLGSELISVNTGHLKAHALRTSRMQRTNTNQGFLCRTERRTNPGIPCRTSTLQLEPGKLCRPVPLSTLCHTPLPRSMYKRNVLPSEHSTP